MGLKYDALTKQFFWDNSSVLTEQLAKQLLTTTSPTYLKPGWDETPVESYAPVSPFGDVVANDTLVSTKPPVDEDSKVTLMKMSRRLKMFKFNIKDFTALLQGNCWLRCKGFPKGATVIESWTDKDLALGMTVYHPTFPKVPWTQLLPVVPCDTKQFVRKGKKKDKVQNAPNL